MRTSLPGVCCAAIVMAGGLVAGEISVGFAEDEVTLKYDDGSMEAKRSTTGGGHAVLFQRPAEGPWYLDGVELFGARYGHEQPPDEDFTIFITDPTLERNCAIARPYATFERGPEKWASIALPPVQVPESFYVCVVFNPTQTKGVYVGIDQGVKESHSRNAVPGSYVGDVEQGIEWMIRARLTRKPQGTVMELLDQTQRETKRQEELAAREARHLKGAKATVLKYDDGQMEDHFSYGGATAQTVAFEAPPGEQYVYGISFYGSQYGGQHDADAVCGDVYILDAEGGVVSRTSFPYSLLTYQKGWIEVPTLPTQVTGKFHVAIHAHSEQYKGIYIGFDKDVEATHSSLGRVARQQFTFRPVPEKYEWMIRAKLADRPLYFDGSERRAIETGT